MIVKAGLLIDLGNSETRATSLVSNKKYPMILSNKFAELQSGVAVPKEYKNSKTTVFYNGGMHFANGQYVEREFVGLEIRPSAIQSKGEQLSTDLSLNLVFIQALLKLAEIYSVPVSTIDATFSVSIIIPPLEHDTKADVIADKIRNIKTVKAQIPVEMDIPIKIESVNVYPEGVAAFFGAFYKEEEKGGMLSLVEVPENKIFETGYVLVLDIGAGTTDVVLIKDTELVLNSKDTFNRGGNTVESLARNGIKKKYGFSPKSLANVIATCELSEGIETHYVEDILNHAKDTYSKALMEDLRQYLERMMVDMQEIKGILVVGGGSLPSIRKDENGNDVIVSPAMSSVLQKYLKVLAPKIQLMNINNKNARLLNIEGLEYIHKYS